MKKSIKVLIVDDHSLIRDAIINYFEGDDVINIVDQAVNGQDALSKIELHSPDLVLTDINMPEMDGQELIKEVKSGNSKTKMIALTMVNETQQIKKLLSMGVDGYMLKNCGKEELKQGILQVMAGANYYSANVVSKVMEALSKRTVKERTVTEMPLSSREKDVLKLVLLEYSNNEIADELSISVRTVDAHKRNLLEKTGSKNLVGLVIYAIEKGLA